MAGPWFVDPENGSISNNGLSTSSPWLLIPGQTGASSQTGYGVVAGDTINIKNGTTSTLKVVPPVNNLTYRGYGVASNLLWIDLPNRDPSTIRSVSVAREFGAHEGMWIIDARGTNDNAISISNARTGIVLEDFKVYGNLVGAASAVLIGSTTGLPSGASTLRRFEIIGSGAVGLSVPRGNVTLEWFRVKQTTEDCLVLAANLNNSYRAGTTSTLRYFNLEDPNYGVTADGTGDCLQLTMNEGRWEGAFVASDFVLTNRNTFKQCVLLGDATGGITLKRFHARAPGNAELSRTAFMLTTIIGSLVIEDGYFASGTARLPIFRIRGHEEYVGSYLTGPSASITLRNIAVDGSERGIANFFDAAETTYTLEMAGSLKIENCTTSGDFLLANSFDAAVSLTGGNTTYAATFNLTLRNNAFVGDGASVRLPTGTANDADYQVKNNAFGGTFAIGATEYSTVAAFEAAHSGATSNMTASAAMLTDSLRPAVDSAIIGAGVHVTYRRDIAKVQRPKPPAIGAYDVVTLVIQE